MPPPACSNGLAGCIAEAAHQIPDDGCRTKPDIAGDATDQRRQVWDDNVVGAIGLVFFTGDRFVERVAVAPRQIAYASTTVVILPKRQTSGRPAVTWSPAAVANVSTWNVLRV